MFRLENSAIEAVRAHRVVVVLCCVGNNNNNYKIQPVGSNFGWPPPATSLQALLVLVYDLVWLGRHQLALFRVNG